ncbi:LOW QUALITY PROTEIN: hypothetical protein YC2023_018021 [Brassica napus]
MNDKVIRGQGDWFFVSALAEIKRFAGSDKFVQQESLELWRFFARLHERASYPSFAVLIERFCRFSRSVSSLGDAEAVSFVEKMVELWYEHEMASTRRQARDLSFAKIKSQALLESDQSKENREPVHLAAPATRATLLEGVLTNHELGTEPSRISKTASWQHRERDRNREFKRHERSLPGPSRSLACLPFPRRHEQPDRELLRLMLPDKTVSGTEVTAFLPVLLESRRHSRRSVNPSTKSMELEVRDELLAMDLKGYQHQMLLVSEHVIFLYSERVELDEVIVLWFCLLVPGSNHGRRHLSSRSESRRRARKVRSTVASEKHQSTYLISDLWVKRLNLFERDSSRCHQVWRARFMSCFENGTGKNSSLWPPPSSANCLNQKRRVCWIHTMKNLRIRFLRFLMLKRNQHRNQMENELLKEFIDQRLYYKYDYKCKVNLRIHKLFVRSVLDLSGKEIRCFDKERCISIYTRKKQELHNKSSVSPGPSTSLIRFSESDTWQLHFALSIRFSVRTFTTIKLGFRRFRIQTIIGHNSFLHLLTGFQIDELRREDSVCLSMIGKMTAIRAKYKKRVTLISFPKSLIFVFYD